VNLWLHLLAFAAYAGATLALLLICLPLARKEDDPEHRRRIAAGVMRVYDPLTIAALGVLVMTGAFNLTGYKAALQNLFFDRLGTLLAWKLFLTFLLINVGAYMAFGLGHRLVRSNEVEQPVDAVWVDSLLRRLRVSAALALLLIGLIAWVALRMTHPGIGGAI
jgi:uncharacterized membrane protein